MQNIQITVTGNTATIVVDLSQRLGRSASGKTVLIASTEGNVSIPGHSDIKMGLNLYTK